MYLYRRRGREKLVIFPSSQPYSYVRREREKIIHMHSIYLCDWWGREKVAHMHFAHLSGSRRRGKSSAYTPFMSTGAEGGVEGRGEGGY